MLYIDFMANVMLAVKGSESDEIQRITNNVLQNINTYTKGIYLTEKALTIRLVTTDVESLTLTIEDTTTLSVPGDKTLKLITGAEVTGDVSGFKMILLTDGVYDEENDLTTFTVENTSLFNGDSNITVTKYWTWTPVTGYTYTNGILALPALFTELSEPEFKDLAQNRQYPLRSYPSPAFSRNDQSVPCVLSMGLNCFRTSSYLIRLPGEIYIKGRKQIAPMTDFTNSAVLPVPQSWENMLLSGVLGHLYLAKGDKDNYKHYINDYQDSLIMIKETEETNDAPETVEREYDYQNDADGYSLGSERPDDGVHHWWD